MLSRTLFSRSHRLTHMGWPVLPVESKGLPARARSSTSVARAGFVSTALLWGSALGLAPQTSVWITRVLGGLDGLALLIARLKSRPGRVQPANVYDSTQGSDEYSYFVRGPPVDRG